MYATPNNPDRRYSHLKFHETSTPVLDRIIDPGRYYGDFRPVKSVTNAQLGTRGYANLGTYTR